VRGVGSSILRELSPLGSMGPIGINSKSKLIPGVFPGRYSLFSLLGSMGSIITTSHLLRAGWSEAMYTRIRSPRVVRKRCMGKIDPMIPAGRVVVAPRIIGSRLVARIER
jgi:hypothetical protein